MVNDMYLIDMDAVCESCGEPNPIKCSNCPLPNTGCVDAVPVVRCKDCEYSFVLGESDLQKEAPYKYYRKDVLMCGCEEHFGDYPESVDSMFYCGYGKRKDGDS